MKYLWEINGVSSETITAAKDSILKTEGLKNIRLRLITNIGCVSQFVDTAISVSAKPKIDFLPDDVRCIGKAFVLTDKSIPGSNSTFSKLTSWQWEADDIKENQTNLSTNFTKTYDVKDATIKLLVSSSTGCLDSLSKPIKIYPNPANDKITVSFDRPVNEKVRIQIINTSGMTIFSSGVTPKGKIVELDVSGLASGIYIVNIRTKDFITNKKVIIIK